MFEIFYEDTKVLDFDPEFFRLWVVKILESESKTPGDITVVFTSDAYLLNMNIEHLNHDYYTDIITFDYSTDVISGDLFISIDRVEENATLNNVSFLEEIYRVVAHGCLHLCGYKDKEPGDVVIMREKEDFAISLVVSRETKN
jgi:probable rRNA maturation factor